MNKTIKIIIPILAAIWHIAIIVLIRIKDSQQPKIRFKELLKLAETDLLELLNRKMEKLPEKERQRPPYKKWSKEIRFLKKEMEKMED